MQAAIEDGIPVVEGDATRDEVLRPKPGSTGHGRVIASVASSSDNLVITLSAKAIRPEHATSPPGRSTLQTEKKLSLAGADAVVTPELVGGTNGWQHFATQPGT